MPNENLQSINQWVWNCDKDFDYRVIWDDNGTITIQRILLNGIKFYVDAYNPLDGWLFKSRQQMLENPTSGPHTFNVVDLKIAFQKDDVVQLWGHNYIIKGKIVVVYGGNGRFEDTVITTVSGCFTGEDPNYFDFYGCTPPIVGCI